jgi:putative heme iron utilization protein
LQKVETAMAQVEADHAARSALMQQGIPIFKIATPSDIQAAEGNKIALPVVESDHHEIQAADARCAICLGKYKDGAEIAWLKCNHHGDVGCLARWLQTSPSCHMCRQIV